jgi:hypothetical protein
MRIDRVMMMVGCALVPVGMAACADAERAGVTEPVAPRMAVAAECDGSYNCKLPNTYPCQDPNDPGANRLAHRDNPADCRFNIRSGTVLRDGFGNARGTVTDGAVRINYGQRKRLPSGTVAVYAFSVGTTNGAASGWIHEADVTESLAHMGTVTLANPGNGDYVTPWRLTGGTAPVNAFYGDMVLHNTHKPCGHLPVHYLMRSGNVVNVLYNLPGLGGVSNDTYAVGTGDVFRRSYDVTVRSVPFYHKDAPLNGAPFGYMDFMYGHVNGRYGWVARDAVTSDPPGTVIVDSNNALNDAAVAKFQVSASWTFSSGTTEYYGDGYYHAPTGSVSDPATFWFYLPAPATRTVDAWWTTYANRSSGATYIAYNASGAELGRASADQKLNGGKWNQIGSWSFSAGWNRVVLSRWAASGAYVVADAIKVR